MALINIKTGEILDIDCEDIQLSEAYKAVKQELNKLEKIADEIALAIKDRSYAGMRFAGYWEIRQLAPRLNETEDSKLLPKDVKKEFNKNKKEFDNYKKTIFADILAKKQPTLAIYPPKY